MTEVDKRLRQLDTMAPFLVWDDGVRGIYVGILRKLA